jgi:hypothetical protein
MMKNFKLTERFTAQFSVDAFHLFNSPQWQNGSFNTAINLGSGTCYEVTAGCAGPSVFGATVAIRVPADVLIKKVSALPILPGALAK